MLYGDELTEFYSLFFPTMSSLNQASIPVSVVSMSLWDHGRGRSPVVVTYTPALQNGAFATIRVLSLQETLSSFSLKEREPLENVALYKGFILSDT